MSVTFQDFAAFRDGLAAKGETPSFTTVLAAFPEPSLQQLQAWNARWEIGEALATAATTPPPRLNPRYGTRNVNVWEGP